MYSGEGERRRAGLGRDPPDDKLFPFPFHLASSDFVVAVDPLAAVFPGCVTGVRVWRGGRPDSVWPEPPNEGVYRGRTRRSQCGLASADGNRIKRGVIGAHTCAAGGGDGAPEPLAPDPSDPGALYGMTVYPKNSLPNGRFSAAGTWRPSTNVSFVTIFGLLQRRGIMRNRPAPPQSPSVT